MNADSLLMRLKRGERLAEREIDSVRRALADKGTSEDKYTLVHVLWKSGDVQSRDVIKAQLVDADEMVRRIALQAVTELFPDDEAFDLALNSLRDPSQYVRMAAATALGSLGATLPARSAEAARLLLEFFVRRQAEMGPEWEAYYEGLLELMQVPQDRRPLATKTLRAGDIDNAVIASARRLASP